MPSVGVTSERVCYQQGYLVSKAVHPNEPIFFLVRSSSSRSRIRFRSRSRSRSSSRSRSRSIVVAWACGGVGKEAGW